MILVTGSMGQIGIDLVSKLANIHGADQIVATDVRPPAPDQLGGVRFTTLDVTDARALDSILSENDFDTVYHLAGILSATGENNPDLCWKVNIEGLEHMLKAARSRNFRLFWPSSIAVFGPATENTSTPQHAVMDPMTMYGVTKTSGELLCRYYFHKFGVDVRSIRFPGIISHVSPPGGGTTDWAVAMFFQALEAGNYSCFVSEDTRLPMMYMPDAVKSILDLMEAPSDQISVRTSYNLTAFSFSAGELAHSIRAYLPNFLCSYDPDFRQEIANAWPSSIDDSIARTDWNWNPEFNLDTMVDDMITEIRKKPDYLPA
ncbi:MAG: NAD-dependent epimerase/dehydratase family protein [Bacteroidetes bacterium]|nr:MAG: NAD-dependent epimerase/dehydratase family protein [Bacteroidota bacterium]